MESARPRECGATDNSRSLFCALQKACIEVLGAYEHRRVALQEVRFAVEEVVDVSKLGGHRLMGFNNLQTTTFSDIKRVLETAKARVAGRLPKKRKYPVEHPGLRAPRHLRNRPNETQLCGFFCPLELVTRGPPSGAPITCTFADTPFGPSPRRRIRGL
jgi:hypothetical protein